MSALKICPNCGTRYDDSHRFCFLDGAALVSESPHAELIGTVIADRYHIISKLGEGGMGEVYLAEHVRIKRKSAVKIMRPGMMGDAVAVSRFNREAENASQISHPNVAAVYDFGETANGLIFLAMEYIDGESLHATLDREKALHAVRAADIIRQAADALSAAHGHGILHRDLKPDNIMLAKTRSGTDVVKIVDFGIARVMSSRTQAVTSTGLIVGTPDYMSPEQLAGDQLDARSDIYALALIAFHVLTGAFAFPSATSKETLLARLTQLPRRLKEVKDDINWPEALQGTFDRALAPDPADRYEDALDFANELELAIYMMPATQTAELYRKALEARRSTPRSMTPPASRAMTTPSLFGIVPALNIEIPVEPSESMYDTRLDRTDADSLVPEASTQASAAPDEQRSRGRRSRALALGAVALVVVLGAVALYRSRGGNAIASSGVAADTASTAAAVRAVDSTSVVDSATAIVPDSALTVLSENDLVRRARSGIVRVISSRGEATGFIADSTRLVVTQASRLTQGEEPAVQIDDRTRVRARVVATDDANDLAVLAINTRFCASCAVLLLATGDSVSRPAPNDSVFAVGGAGRRWRGAVTSRAPLATSVRVTGSSTGAPLLARDGRVLAMTTSGASRRLVPAAAVRELIASARRRVVAAGFVPPNDSLLAIVPTGPVPQSVLDAAKRRTPAQLAPYRASDGNGEGSFAVLAMTPQVVAWRASEAAAALAARKLGTITGANTFVSLDPVQGWTGWNELVQSRRLAVVFEIAPSVSAYPSLNPNELKTFRRGNFASVALYRDGVLVKPLTPASAVPAVVNPDEYAKHNRAVFKTGVVVYDVADFMPKGDQTYGAYQLAITDATKPGSPVRIGLPAAMLKAIYDDVMAVR